ncbi:hypothetical protein D3C72_517910 [compost metagenome]
MKEDKGFTLALSWIIGSAAGLAICYMIGIALGVTRLEGPAVIQAIGSIAAVAVAIWVMNRQSTRAREEVIEQRQFEDGRKFRTVLAILESLLHSSVASVIEFKKIQSEFPNVFVHKFSAIQKLQLTNFSDMKDALLQVPLWEVPDHKLVIQITRCLRAQTDCIEAFEHALRAIQRFDDMHEMREYNFEIEGAMNDRIDFAIERLFVMHDSTVSGIERCNELLPA